MKNLNLFCKTYKFFSGDCLLVERNTLTSCFLTFGTLPFSFLNLIFVEKKKRKLTPFSFHTIYTTFSIKKWWTAFNVAFVKINLFCSLSSFKTTSSFTNGDFHMKRRGKKKKDKSTVSTQKNVRPLVGLFQPKRKSSFVALSKMRGLMKMINKTWMEAN